MFCACFSAFHFFNKKLSCIWKFMIESNGVCVNFEIEKCSDLAACLELYRPGADLRIQKLKDEKNPKFQEKLAPVIAGLKQS